MTKYRWVYSGSRTFRDVGILADGSLHNPNGYPDEEVRAAVLAADAQRHERRSRGAKEAAETRARRRARRVWEAARRIVAAQSIGPRRTCYACGRGLGDPASITRGIGSECWQEVLTAIEAVR